ncbi:MAG: hypothetical protein NZ898_05960 [Myxococcota bacterium]|nr:hypothetical protein [Myxococcota bacterium]MDW8361441.1 hypothetical protein [Myxococcales bacterium]
MPTWVNAIGASVVVLLGIGCTADDEFCNPDATGLNCVCAGGDSCDIHCGEVGECDTQCSGGSRCSVDCEGTRGDCDVECASAASCEVDCRSSSSCQVTCPARCTVRNCTLGSGCNVTCGLSGVARQQGPDAVCGAT